jgi:hypothetical protein
VPSTSAARRMSAFCSAVRRTATRSVLVATNALCAYRAYRSIRADAVHRPTAPTVGAAGVGSCRPRSPTSSRCAERCADHLTTLKDPAPCFRDRASLDQVCPAPSAPYNTCSPGCGGLNVGTFAYNFFGVAPARRLLPGWGMPEAVVDEPVPHVPGLG